MKKCRLSLEVTHWVTSDLTLTLNSEISYDTHDPLAVTVVLDADGERPVRWIFARDLLADGLSARVGEGDVALWPVCDLDGEASSFCLRVGGARKALFEIPAEPVRTWLAGTYTMVPRGAELDGVDWDELVQLAE
ncbi:SsgA family sporulation/cell division regulator [Streptomyces sp. NPDC046870]|uniref:SsgA family sporulation/cell division regulator n=1 Tax=Streptomyces sp. NPDC046870 TaxID=3155135 RepID=UPI0034547DED